MSLIDQKERKRKKDLRQFGSEWQKCNRSEGLDQWKLMIKINKGFEHLEHNTFLTRVQGMFEKGDATRSKENALNTDNGLICQQG